MRLRVLGPVEIESDDGAVQTLARRQERCLLAILLLEVDRVVSIDRICELLWDDEPPRHARRAVHAHVARIRGALSRAGSQAGSAPAAELVSHGDGYLIRTDRDTVDAHRFRALLARAADTCDLDERDRVLREAIAEWRGPALHNAATSRRLRQRLCVDLDEQYLQAVELSLETGLELGRHRELLPELARLRAANPLRERLLELHMLALHRDGQTAEALAVYRHARANLIQELGIEPNTGVQRLHRAILRDEPMPTAQPAALRAADPGVTPSQLPADLAAFVGRTEYLDQLDDILRHDATAAVVAVSGMAGAGKTTLALHWAHRVRHHFASGQLYVNLRGFDPGGAAVEAATALRGFLDALGVPAQRVPADPDAQACLYRSLLAGRRMLIVLDNARDADQVRPLLPGAPGCVVVVTSRSKLTGLVAVDGAHPLTVDLLSTVEAHDLLARRLGPPRVAAEPEAAKNTIARCAGLPLALVIVAARAATNPRFTLAALADEMRRASSELDIFAGEDLVSDVRAVFSWSYQALSQPAARLFRLLGLHPGAELSGPAAASLAGAPAGQVYPSLDELTRAHLVIEQAPGRYTLHDLLRAYAAELAHVQDSDPERQASLHRLYDHYLHTAHAAALALQQHRMPIMEGPPPRGVAPEAIADAGRAFTWFTEEYDTLLAVLRQAHGTRCHTHVWQLAWSMEMFMFLRGLGQDWVAAEELALDAARQIGDAAGQAHTHRGLAGAHLSLRRYPEAEANLRHALDFYEQLGDAANRGYTHINLCIVLERQGRPNEAMDSAQRALELCRTSGHLAQARALNAVGWFHAHLGRPEQAIGYCTESIALSRAVGDDTTQAAAWDSLGRARHLLGQFAEATNCYEQALRLHRGTYRHGAARALCRLAEAHLAVGHRQAAHESWQQALDILDELDHPDADRVRADLALSNAAGRDSR